MIEGHVNEALEPVVEIGLKGSDAVTAIPAIIDTGFSGCLCLSEQYIGHLVMTFKFVERYELANGEVIAKDVFVGNIVFDRREQEVDLILTASQDTLIGASLLQETNVNIDYLAGTVRIERSGDVSGAVDF